MRKILLLSVSLLLLGVGGAKATITNASFSVAYNVGWDSGTNTMTWKSTSYVPGSFCILNTGLPSGDITGYTKIIAYLSDFSENADFVKLRIKDTGENYADVDLREGFNNIDLVALQTSYPSCDFKSIYDITIWNSNTATEGHTIDKDNPASVVISELYLYDPVKTISVGSFGDEITSLDYITGNGASDPQKFVISDNGTKAKYFYTNNENENANVEDVPADAYCYFTLEKYDGDDIAGDNIYWIKITNANGEGYPRGSDGITNYYLNAVLTYADVVISGTKSGWGGDKKGSLWYVTYDAEKGFSFQNVYRVESGKKSWLAIGNNFEADQQYLKLYKSIEIEESTDLEKFDNPANDAIFALENATGYNAETGILKDGGWTFVTPVDLSDWDYLIITTEETQREDNTYIRIADDDGKYVEQNGYAPGDQPEMYFSYWNNHNAACISMDYLRKEKDLDISKIKSLTFSGIGLKISSVYLTDYENTKLGPSRGRYSLYVNGDVVREYIASTVGKFGTICLPYVASCAGAEVYSIAGIDGSSISLTKVSGLLEAGKPYFYKASDTVGKRGEDVHNVNFFRADLSKFDAASAGTNNGLIGTFSGISPLEPNDDYYVLSNNTLYQVDAGAVDEKAVSIGANKAYVDISQIVNLGGAVKAFINCIGNDETAIQAIESLSPTPSPVSEGSIFNVAGQRMSKLQKGVNIVNGKKVLVK